MTNLSPEELFRQAADGEGGMPVSAGARLLHVRVAVEGGRAFLVDLSSIPEEKRPLVVAEIKELVNRASNRSSRNNAELAHDAPSAVT
jgi:hypothetical protein